MIHLCEVSQLLCGKSRVQKPDLFWYPGTPFQYYIMVSIQGLFYFDLKWVFLGLLSVPPCPIRCSHKGNSDICPPGSWSQQTALLCPLVPSLHTAHLQLPCFLTTLVDLCVSILVVCGPLHVSFLETSLEPEPGGLTHCTRFGHCPCRPRKSSHTCSYCIHWPCWHHVVGEGWGLN